MKPLLTHIAMRCADMDRAIAFYKSWCDLDVLHRRADPAPDGKGLMQVAWLGRPAKPGENPAFVLVLLETRVPPGATSLFDHLGFAVASRADVDALAERGKAEGIIHWTAGDAGPVVGYLCAVKDPDGNVVEFSFGQKLGAAE
ncbi:MAG: VOC family protein [Planctomycetota bacterium]|nr:VOC family protein [Planctomycetota bacterium]